MTHQLNKNSVLQKNTYFSKHGVSILAKVGIGELGLRLVQEVFDKLCICLFDLALGLHSFREYFFNSDLVDLLVAERTLFE